VAKAGASAPAPAPTPAPVAAGTPLTGASTSRNLSPAPLAPAAASPALPAGLRGSWQQKGPRDQQCAPGQRFSPGAPRSRAAGCQGGQDSWRGQSSPTGVPGGASGAGAGSKSPGVLNQEVMLRQKLLLQRKLQGQKGKATAAGASGEAGRRGVPASGGAGEGQAPASGKAPGASTGPHGERGEGLRNTRSRWGGAGTTGGAMGRGASSRVRHERPRGSATGSRAQWCWWHAGCDSSGQQAHGPAQQRLCYGAQAGNRYARIALSPLTTPSQALDWCTRGSEPLRQPTPSWCTRGSHPSQPPSGCRTNSIAFAAPQRVYRRQRPLRGPPHSEQVLGQAQKQEAWSRLHRGA